MSLTLVTGAAGGLQGSTGLHLTHLLHTRSTPVRALVRSNDARAAALRASGIEVVVADLLDPQAVRMALDGVSRAFFSYPVKAGLLEASAIFAAEGRRAGLRGVVALSHLNAGPEAPSPRTREHGLAEEVLDWAAVGAIHLRGAVFFENIRRHGLVPTETGLALRLPLGSGDTRLPLIAGEDIARIAAGLLADLERWSGKRVFAIAEVMSLDEAATALSEALHHRIDYQPMSDDAWREAAIAREGVDNPVQIEHLAALWRTMRMVAQHDPGRFRPTTELIEPLIGAPPRTLHAFAADQPEAFFHPVQRAAATSAAAGPRPLVAVETAHV